MDSQVFDDLFKSMFGESEGAEERSGSDGMLESLMKIDIDPDYWEQIDIDSLDPEWPESQQRQEEEKETEQRSVVMLDHERKSSHSQY